MASDRIPTTVKPHRHSEVGPIVLWTMHTIVLVLSVLLIVYISIDTFEEIDFLQNSHYMTFQLWVCVVFIIDFFVEMYFAAG